ncbi:eukaryotic translation initiation factor 2-alpha kinase eif2-alpha kinase -related [Anaeramoeba ignava]|uniref:Eukaryotic translation initiation factor 2-alpha kinase eif2-alpha kinase -related n=1 Tax=Anaeramoeba ignava TaxID=1746090 RepID=A0A9Q0RG83_ANAIG|nr:eukaryotic translation initiation factor 2-alpha kinase eif2-alpha kinase -related [Anaeramoeba ignava]
MKNQFNPSNFSNYEMNNFNETLCKTEIETENSQQISLIASLFEKNSSLFKFSDSIDSKSVLDESNLNLLKYVLLRNWIEEVNLKTSQVNSGFIEPSQKDLLEKVSTFQLPFNHKINWYHLNFEELERIGTGGFGSVYRSRHKRNALLFQSKINCNHLNILDHPNVIRYYSVWLDIKDDTTVSVPKSPSTEDFQESFNTENETGPQIDFPNWKDPSFEVVFRDYENYNNSNNDEIIFGDKNNSMIFEADNIQAEHAMEIKKDDQYNKSEDFSFEYSSDQDPVDFYNYKMEKSDCILYIQMELCRAKTLRDWLENYDRKVDIFEVKKIFKQILEGMKHCHQQNVIHRDLKPDNIFITSDLNIKIADFGLSRSLEKNHFKNTRNNEGFQSACGCGTILYSSPEQLFQSNSCDSTTDVYSLGIILFELLYPFRTQMERVKLIKSLRDHYILPEEISQEYPEFANLILQMVSYSPSTRPTCSQILKNKLFLDQDQQEMQFIKQKIQEKRKQIKELKNMVKLLESELNCNNM